MVSEFSRYLGPLAHLSPFKVIAIQSSNLPITGSFVEKNRIMRTADDQSDEYKKGLGVIADYLKNHATVDTTALGFTIEGASHGKRSQEYLDGLRAGAATFGITLEEY